MWLEAELCRQQIAQRAIGNDFADFPAPTFLAISRSLSSPKASRDELDIIYLELKVNLSQERRVSSSYNSLIFGIKNETTTSYPPRNAIKLLVYLH
jgi:hypothetical protein